MTAIRLFRRREPLHRRLAEAGALDGEPTRRGPAADPPGFDGEARGEAGIHGVPRARRFDAVVTAEAPDVTGDAVHFVTLSDGTAVIDGEHDADQRDGALTPLQEAVEASIPRPYRAEAVRRGSTLWAVAARRIVLVAAPGLDGEEVELVSTRDGRTLHVDGQPRFGSVPAFEQAGSAVGGDYAVHATRIDGDLWEVRAAAL